MKFVSKATFFILPVILFTFIISGCSITIQKGRRSDIEKIDVLTNEIAGLNARLDLLQQKKDDEISDLEKTKQLLENRLKKEIGDKDVRLEMAAKGLSIIFLAEVLFDSGKAEVKKEAYGVLDKIANVLKKDVGNANVGVEGHTDNEPIKYSGWKSNWELATARATSVLHYLADEKGIQEDRLSVIGYAQYKPVASNSTDEGRRQNRRVEIVILPKNIEKINADMDEIAERKRDIQKRLKKYKK